MLEKVAPMVLGGDFVVVYAVPTYAKNTEVKKIILCNSNVSTLTVSMNFVPAKGVPDASNAVLAGNSLEKTLILELAGTALVPGDTIQAKASGPGVAIHISVDEETD
jgi:hypothetical protein